MLVRFCTSTRRRSELLIAAAVIVIITVMVAGGSFFDRDDLFFAEYFQLNPPSVDALTRSWFGHLMPGYIASVIAFLTLFGLSWPVALVLTAAIHTGAFVALVRCLDAVLGPVRLNVIAGVAFSLSLGPMMVRLWWAATLNNFLALALGLAVLGCATRWVVRRRARHLVAALLLYALALTMSEKNLLFSLHIAAWCVLVVWRGLSARSRIAEIVRAWPLWIGLVLLSLIDVIAFLRGPYLQESGTSPGLGTSIRFVAHNILGGLFPSLFGIDMADQPASFTDPRVVVSSALVAAFVVWTIVRTRANVGVWVFALVAVSANAAVLSRRADLLGEAGGRQLRYLLESSALLWLAIGVAAVLAMSVSRATPSDTRRRDRSADRRRRVLRTVGGGLAAGLILFSAWSWSNGVLRAIGSSGGYAAREWIETLRTELPNPLPAALIDTPLSSEFAIPQLHPYDMVAPVLPSLGWTDVRTTNVLEGAWTVGEDGRAGPAVLASPDVQFSGSRCSDGSTLLPVPEAHTRGRTFIVLDFSRSEGASVGLQFSGCSVSVDLDASQGRIAVYLPNPVDGDLVVDPHGAPLCVDAITAADVVPASN